MAHCSGDTAVRMREVVAIPRSIGDFLSTSKRNFLTYCANPKTVNTRIISGMLLCWEEKANQTQDEKTASNNGNLLCRLRFLISYLIGHRTIKMTKSNQSVHGFWIRTGNRYL